MIINKHIEYIGTGIPTSTSEITGKVDDFSSLPSVAESIGNVYIVLNNSGVWPFTYKASGLYYSNGVAWVRLSEWKDRFNADSFSIFLEGPNRELKYNINALTTTRTLSVQDQDGTIDLLKDNVITVAKSGGNFTTIEGALASITDNSESNRYTIEIYPGEYTIDNSLGAIQLKEYVTLSGSDYRNVAIIPNTPANDMFIGAAGSDLIGLRFKFNTGSSYVMKFAVPGSISIVNCALDDCVNGFQLNNATADFEIKNLSITNLTSTVSNTMIDIVSGLASLIDVVFGDTCTASKGIVIDGATTQVSLQSILMIAPGITTGIECKSGLTIGNGVSVGFCATGLLVYGNNTKVQLDSTKIQFCSVDGFRVDNVGTGIEISLFSTTVIDCTNNFDILNPNSTIIGNGYTQFDKSFIVDGAKFYAYILDTKEADEGLKILGELHVGTSTRPAESVFGAGDSHTFEYAYTFDGVSTYTDQTAIAISATASNFAFDGVTAGNSLYIANRYPITFEGIKVLINTAAVLGTGSMVAEYWNGSSWVEFNGCTVKSSPGFLKYAKNYFNQVGSYHVKYNPYIRDSWAVNDPVGIGTDYYWMRFRIVTAITTSPVIEQIKIHTNRAEINTDGTLETHMDARVYKKLTVDAVRPIEGSMQNASIYVDENVGVGLENNRFTTAGDLLGISFELPEDCDTSAPLIFVWKGKFATAGSVDFTVRTKVVKPGDVYTNTEPTASGETIIVTTGTIAIAAGDTREDFRVDIDISDAIPSRENGFGDEIWITLQYPTRGAGNFDYTKLSANYLSDFAGRHIRQ